jgi:outer membrane protein assembly factor BamB
MDIKNNINNNILLAEQTNKKNCIIYLAQVSQNLPSFLAIFIFILAGFFLSNNLFAQDSTSNDWPMFRDDAQRTSATTENLPDQFKLVWTRQFPPLVTSSPDDPRIQFDKSYHPIVLSKTLFIASSINDCLYAISTTTGEILWKFYADAPIRFAPAGVKDKLFCVSDDSYLYCIQASTGKLLWKFRGAPNDSKILVNGRLASPWPARGGPAIFENKVYFSAGIWPFMGVFIYAIDIETGKVIWVNSGSGSLYKTQAHDTDATPGRDSEAFAGPAPQGYISATKDIVLIPNGRSVPAAYDAKTGELLYYHLPLKAGGYYTPSSESFFFFANTVFKLKDGKSICNIPSPSILTPNFLYAGALQAFDLKNISQEAKTPEDKTLTALPLTQLWKDTLNADLQFLAGNRLYTSNANSFQAYELPETNKELKAPKLAWTLETKGTIAELITADKKIFAITLEGELSCFADSKNTVQPPPILAEIEKPINEISTTNENIILLTTKMYKGYAIVLGAGTGGIAEQLAKKTQLSVIVVEPDINLVNKLRMKWDDAQIYGSRIVILQGNPFEFPFPPYLANLIVSEKIDFAKEKISNVVSKIFHALRPYGGTACLQIPDDLRDRWTHAIYENNLQMAGNRNKNGLTLLIREGQLLGAGNWSHQYADATNSGISNDSRVKLPLGLLWFGGPSNKNVLPRHGHGPNPQVAGGRVVTEGPGNLQAYDVYTGRVFWELQIPELGKAFDSNDRQPGANSIGGNYVTLADYIYIVFRGKCIKLESETGAVLEVFELPPLEGQKESPKWGFLAVSGDYLIATAEPIDADNKATPGKFTWNGSTSKAIVILNRHTGQMVWKKEATHGFRHNAIAIGNEYVFCIDFIPDEIRQLIPSAKKDGVGKLYSFNLRTGDLLWSTDQGIFGTWLSYSVEYDILLQAGRPSRDMLNEDQKNRMSAFLGKTGALLWDKGNSYSGPCLINDKDILTQNIGYNLLDGSQKTKIDPITNERIGWSFSKNYGCASATGSKNILTFRSASAGYFDLTNDGGTGNFGGFRSSCTSNLIVADGVLNAPDYTRGCTCSYQNQTSLALVYQPNVETWTFTSSKWTRSPIQRLGVNLGAPGDRISDTKTLWMEYPSIGGPSQEIPIKCTPEKINWFCQHSSFIQDPELSWVGASGAKGITSITIPTGFGADKDVNYTVRLIFIEPEDIKPNERLMNISIQGKVFIEALDIIKETKVKNKILIKEFKNIKTSNEIIISLTPNPKATKQETILCGVEIILE